MVRKIGFLNFVHRPYFNITTFRKLGPGLRLAQPGGPTAWVSVLPFLSKDGRRSSFRNVVLYWNTDNGQSPKSTFTILCELQPIRHLVQLPALLIWHWLLLGLSSISLHTTDLVLLSGPLPDLSIFCRTLLLILSNLEVTCKISGWVSLVREDISGDNFSVFLSAFCEIDSLICQHQI
jgi:hypothetical protein